jgi:hypothetical protein
MKGEVVYLYAFDVANEIMTANLTEILSSRSFPFEVRTDHTYPKDVPLYRPLTIEPPSQAARMNGKPVRVIIRVFDVGVIDVMMRVAIEAGSLTDLTPLHNPRLETGQPLDQFARKLCDETCASIRQSIVQGAPATEPEAYTIFVLTNIGDPDAGAWFHRERRAVAGLLSETAPETLSEMQVDESLRVSRSFGTRDLVVIDWDASLVVELDGYADDVLYVLELANLQLEEFRVMDQRLDRHLERVYKDLESFKMPWFGTARMLKWLRSFRVDVTKLTDEVSHITKFVGDWHLARVYLGAQERFHLQEWRKSVEQRLSQLDQVYGVLQAEVFERRMLWLEIAIVVLFVIDLLGIFIFN